MRARKFSDPDRTHFMVVACPLVCIVTIVGCGGGTTGSAPSPTSSNSSANAPAAGGGPDFAAAMRKAAGAAEDNPREIAEDEPLPGLPDADGEAAPSEEEPEMISEVAAVGDGRKAQAVTGDNVLSVPVAAFFRTGERVVFEIEIPRDMKTFKALDPDGKGPKSHDEFMKEIIEKNETELPELPEGHKYRYDPETELLMVDRPKPK